MKTRIGIFFLLIAGGALITYFNDRRSEGDETGFHHRSLPKDIPSNYDPHASIPLARGIDDDPFARSDFEVQRLKNPATGKIPFDIYKKELAYTRLLPKSNGLMLYSRKNLRSSPDNIEFSQRGPANLGGRTRAVALDVSDASENTILAGGVSGGMWRSTNGGATWVRTTTRDQLPSVSCIVQDTRPGRTDTWYYGTGEITGNSADGLFASGNEGAIPFFRGDGIYRSENGGLSWALIPTTTIGDITTNTNVFRYVNHMVIDHTNLVEDEIYAAVIDGIIRTTDGFQTYEFVLGDSSNISFTTDIAITSTGILYATISDEGVSNNQDPGIWTSADGITWEEIAVPAGRPTSGFQRTTIGISPSNENIVYFLRTEASDNAYSLYRYNAATQDMEDLSANVPSFGGELGDFDSQGSYNQFVKVHPDNSDIVFLGGTNLYRSTNGFRDETATTWVGGYSEFQNADDNVALYFNHHPDQHDLVFFPSNRNRMLSVHDGGISITEDNLRSTVTQVFNRDDEVVDEVTVLWESLNNAYLTTQFYSLAIDRNNPGDPTVMGGMQDNSTYVTTNRDPNTEWFDIFGGDGGFCDVTFNSYYASAQFAQIVRLGFSETSGEFIGFFRIDPPGSGSPPFLFINPMITDPVYPNKVFVAGSGVLYYNLDIRVDADDVRWEAFRRSLIGQGNITAMAASTVPQNKLFLGTGNGGVFRLEDSNEPDEINDITGENFPNGYVNCIAVDPRNADRLFVVFSNYGVLSVFHTTDGGQTWEAVSGNLEENANGSGNGPSTRWLEIMPNGPDNIYFLGTSTGVYSTQSLEGMNTQWRLEGADVIGNVVIDMMKVRPSDGYIAIATHGNGVFEATVDVPLVVNIYQDKYPCVGNNIVLRGNATFEDAINEFDFQYQWLVNGESIPGANSSGLLLNSSEGTYQLQITNRATDETALSNPLVIRYVSNEFCDNTVTSLEEEIIAESGIVAYPNPTQGRFKVAVANDFQTENLEVRLFDAAGKVLEQGIYTSDQLHQVGFDLSAQPAGSYLIEISNSQGKIAKRINKR